MRAIKQGILETQRHFVGAGLGKTGINRSEES